VTWLFLMLGYLAPGTLKPPFVNIIGLDKS